MLAQDATLFTLLWTAQRNCRGGDLLPLKWAILLLRDDGVANRPLRDVPSATDAQGGVLLLAVEHVGRPAPADACQYKSCAAFFFMRN